MERLQRMFAGTGGSLGHPPPDSPTLDSSEQVYISSLALLKMLKHGRAGVPMEVMGLMLGEFVDEYTVRVVDVFAMPQSGTGVSVEAVDHVFQTNMLDMLKQTGRPEMVVGWYHSHPGFGCWLSGVDINTQQSFEALNQRAVAVVVDPIQSVKGKVVIDAFRLINPQTMMLGQEPRQTTSNLGHLNKPSIQALIHGLNRHYYSIAINYRKNELEEKMLLNLHKKKWTDGLTLRRFDTHSKTNEQTVQEMLNLAIKYNKAVQEEDELPPEKLAIANVGRQDAKKHLEEHVSNLMSSNIIQTLGTMLDTVVTSIGFNAWDVNEKDIGFIIWTIFWKDRRGGKALRMERLQRMFAGAGGSLGHPPPDSPTLDSSEQVYISSLALLKMLKHGRAGVPMEVMGLMLGEFVDEYTVRVVDVFAMPQSGTGVSVEAVDHVFQTNMLDMLKQTGRPEMVVGWYHSHPGFGCWLSGVDINTQQSFEALNQRAVAVVVDPIQSVKGKVVIDAFRLINPQTMMLGQEPRQTTSNLGHLNKPSIQVSVEQIPLNHYCFHSTNSYDCFQALIHGLNRHYYSIAINYRKNELEEKMLLNLHKKKWTDGLTLRRFDTHSKTNEQTVQEMLNLAIKYNKAVQEEDELPPEKLAIANVGRQDAKKHLEEHVSNLMSSNIIQTLGTMLDTVVF
ncbi:26S proteasome non-ATPase regulatory subunit 14-like protein [Cucumis melo var. makuwa]|uniref:26S proteasome non-ATPase regulatory subunit 14-like protein n=1 Tax=Cucumis melo var. makuwa TaxID=1194695 RepID=A0A5D3D9P2_CUCMM|nr:26S proteasome non-ATPase regulatory subunit 14-like protein [Cucumis melo var. makuwa]